MTTLVAVFITGMLRARSLISRI